MQQKLHPQHGVYPSCDVVHNDPQSFSKPFQLSNWRWLQNIEYTKKYKARKQRFPRQRSEQQRNPLPGNFVDDDELRILQFRSSRDASRGRNAGGDCNHDQASQNSGLPGERETSADAQPDEDRDQRRPSPWPRLQPSNAKKSRYQKRPSRGRRGRRRLSFTLHPGDPEMCGGHRRMYRAGGRR